MTPLSLARRIETGDHSDLSTSTAGRILRMVEGRSRNMTRNMIGDELALTGIALEPRNIDRSMRVLEERGLVVGNGMVPAAYAITVAGRATVEGWR